MGTPWKVFAWLCFGLIALVVGVYAWIMVSFHISMRKQDEQARNAVNRTVNAMQESLQEQMRDGELSDEEISRISPWGGTGIRAMTRASDKIVITYYASQFLGSMPFGGGSAEVCAVFEIPLPITASTEVHRHDIDDCPPPVYPTGGAPSPTTTTSP
ncbi:hypothetical protein Lesp02_52020 [Lentzea sp. NBRC 105346]|uniref:hypothetical protein n=1 Tax=Lentzea sp. NBRC 105346 TaxID=3032205 RepID=UPI0024A43B3D|nr:hypothetical protein [Lentzea sp. NBRC 105346]GLZ33014.1 hypothetical protein Lesp02_52020 [Lentzea sp. NBRC 105346]